MIAAVVAAMASPGAGAAAPKPRDAPARAAKLIADNVARSEIVRFTDPHQPTVKIVRGASRGPAPAGMVATAAALDSRGPPVAVLRGGAGRLAAPPHRAAEIVVAFADPHEPPVTILRGMVAPLPPVDLFPPAAALDLDRVAFAVDGAESSHGTDPRMWRPELDGPQGPMQVSAAAALDSGGGDRFDLGENRILGRTYLERLYRRFGNWPDAIAAYNWGPGNLDAWIGAGRPTDGLPLEVEAYRDRVLRDSGAPPAPARRQ